MKMLKACLLALAMAGAGFATTFSAQAQGTQSTGNAPAAAAQCYTGIGITVSLMGLQAWELKNPDNVSIELMKPVTVMSITPGSPAEQAKLYRGDKIIEVDGKSTTGLTLPQVIALIDAGAPGSSITLTVRRDGNHIQRTVTLVRANICP